MTDLVKLPVLALKDPTLIIFPGMVAEISVGRIISLNAVKLADTNDSSIIIAMQKDDKVEDPKLNDFYSLCVEVKIKCVLPGENDDQRRAVVVGLHRAHLSTLGKTDEGEDSYLYGEIDRIEDEVIELDNEINTEVAQLYDIVQESLKDIALQHKIKMKTSQDLSRFVDGIASQLPINGEARLSLLSDLNPKSRLKNTLSIVVKLSNQVKVEICSTSSERNEESDDYVGEVKRLYNLIKESGAPEEVTEAADQELRRLKHMSPAMNEFSIIVSYLETLASLPWKKKTEDKIDIEDARRSLDEDHYGLNKPKERILEYLAVRKLNPDNKGAILCFHGSPGTGKTSIGKSIAKAMGRKFIRVSLGGVHDEAEIRGHRRTYVGAMTGKIMHHLNKIGYKNPVFMLDELDKLSNDYRGDPSSALLEVLDPAQNHAFVDNYLNVPFDLSDVMFIGTVNEVAPIPPALRDRMEIIDIPGYSPYDKLKIAQKHLISKQKIENGLEKYDKLSISANAINRIIEEYTGEAGVRSLERECGKVLRKLAVQIASGKEIPNTVRSNSIPNLLGPPKVFVEKAADNPEVGLCAGLSCSSHGGSLLFVESSLTPGKGEVKLTGNLGKVLQESATASYTWLKSNAEELNIDPKKFTEFDIHIHLPYGSIQKEGPSAGVALTCSMLSSFTDRPIRNDIAMTGEISLRGRVMPIGGLVEKTLAAHRAGIKHILFPIQNKYDMDELPNDVKNSLSLHPVSTLIEAINIVMCED